MSEDVDERTPRERIFDAAMACFRRDGVRRTSMDDVARAAGVSRPAVYYYYANKQDLIIDVVLREIAAAHRKSNQALKRADLAGLAAIMEAAFTGIRAASEATYAQLMTSPDGERLTAAALQSEAAMEVEHAFWGPLFDDARGKGQIRTDLPDQELIRLILFVQFSVLMNGGTFGLGSDEAIRRALDLFLRPALRAGP